MRKQEKDEKIKQKQFQAQGRVLRDMSNSSKLSTEQAVCDLFWTQRICVADVVKTAVVLRLGGWRGKDLQSPEGLL